MTRWLHLWWLLGLVVAACGPRRPPLQPPLPPLDQREHGPQAADLEAAISAFEHGDRSTSEFERVLASASDDRIKSYARLYLGRIEAERSPAAGATTLIALADSDAPDSIRFAARHHGGLAAAAAGDCESARRALEIVLPRIDGGRAAHAWLARADCEPANSALTSLSRAVESDPSVRIFALDRALSRLAELSEAERPMAIEDLPEGALRAALAQSQRSAAAAPVQPRVAVFLPLSGRSRPVGDRVAETLLHVAGAGAEDRPRGRGPIIRIWDGGDSGRAADAVRAAADEGATGAVGVFDRETVAAAVVLAGARGLPLIALTRAPIAASADAPVWRGLPTAAAAAEAAAVAAAKRGGRRAVIARGDDTYGTAHADAFRRAWASADGTVVDEVSWAATGGSWRRIARRIADLDFDTLYLPARPTHVALLASHLAASGVWSRSERRSFDRRDRIRSVIFVGTPEWYGRMDLGQMGRYLEGALVPTPYAAESSPGAAFARDVLAATGRAPDLLDALASDAVMAIHAAAGTDADGVTAALRRLRPNGVTAGLDFTSRDAANSMWVVEIADGAWRMTEPRR